MGKDVKVKEAVKVLERTEKKDNNKNNIFKIIGNIVFWTVFGLFLLCAIMSYVNFKKLESDQEPKNYSEKLTYNEEGVEVTVYKYYLYKLVKVTDANGAKVSLKLWFIDDIK